MNGDPCANSWYGVSCSSSGDEVTAVALGSNSLGGTIPTELGYMVDVTKMLLNSNELTGAVPTELGGKVVLSI